MANAYRDQNNVTTLIAASSVDGFTPVRLYADPVTHRLLTDTASGSGTVTSVSVVSANGFAGTVATATTTPAITLSTTVTGILKGNGTAISAASAGTDYQAPISLTTTGTSGVATFIANTLNIPNYGGAASNVTVGTTTITSGTNTRILYDNSGVLGEYSVIPVSLGGTNATSASITAFNNITGYTASGATGTTSTNLVFSTSPTLVTPTLGAATATTINGNTFTTGSYTLTGTAGKTLNFTNTLTLSGTDSTTMTFPSTSATIARTDAAQTFTGIQTIPQVVNTPLAATVSSNAATITRASRINNFTNSSAATMAITLSTTGALDGDLLLVRIYDFSAVPQTIGWTNTENSLLTAPTTSNGSTTLPLTTMWQFNGGTSKWRFAGSF